MVDKVKRERADRAPAKYKYQLVVLTDQPQDAAVRRYAKREGLSIAAALRKLLGDALAADVAARQVAKVAKRAAPAEGESAPADRPLRERVAATNGAVAKSIRARKRASAAA